MSNTRRDDQDASVHYAGSWTHYRGAGGEFDASAWDGGTFSSCTNSTDGGSLAWAGCAVRVTFDGTSAALHGDSNGEHGIYSCRVEDADGQPEGVWRWYDGSSLWWWDYQHNVTLCRVSNLPNATHTLVLDMRPNQVKRGIAIDYFDSNADNAGNSTDWSSDFTMAVPPNSLRDTTATPTLPRPTTSPASSPTGSSSSSSGGGVNKLAIGLGVGLGGFFGLLAIAALVFFFLQKRRRGRQSRRASEQHITSYDGYDGESNWHPDAATVASRQRDSPSGAAKELAADGYNSSPTSGYGYDTPVDAPYHRFSGAEYSSYASQAPYAPADVRRLTAVSAYSSTASSAPGQRASRVPSSVIMDLPPDAPLEDPDNFAAR
ncbi:hypothetical protein Rhopal_003768-T1 [Rhodotorula paludigena]|uniref:Ig-like domain-containing protein n=1 Tax=Rhodotorula paludigena TaxID=86838 RepID=A0AAV5GNC9_9BASI|nr:hypothetical protein Rhopal_003768-T1 [Rhodotorula paludigena]